MNGYGTLLYSPRTMVRTPHATVSALSEEHGWIEVPGGAVHEVGDRVRIVPNHACVAVATQRLVYLVDREEVVAEWAIGPWPIDDEGSVSRSAFAVEARA